LGILLSFKASLFEVLHHLWMARPLYAALLLLTVSFRTQVIAALLFGLVFFQPEWILQQRSVRTHANHLPRYFDVRRVALDLEPIVLDLAGYNRLSELTDDGELITEVAVDGFEPLWQNDDRTAILIGGDIAAVDVEHFG